MCHALGLFDLNHGLRIRQFILSPGWSMVNSGMCAGFFACI